MKKCTGTPSVSVVIPTFTRPDLLAEALESVCCQDLEEFEVIVVNDAGSDVSVLVYSFGERIDLTYIMLDQNGGLPVARNSGVAAARGEYIALMDDDDLWMSDHLSRLSAYLDLRPDVGLCYS